jgi:hypothetical protein
MATGHAKGSADKVAADKTGSGTAESGRTGADVGKAGAARAGADRAAVGKTGARPEPDGTVSADMDDLKRKFREALDRKKDRSASANADGTQGTGKVHDAHGPASSRRSFRRKSGG